MRNLRTLLRVIRLNFITSGLGLLTLGLALGTTSVLLGAIWEIILRPLPVPEVDRLVFIQGLADPIVADPVAWWSDMKSADSLATFSTGRVPVDERNGPFRPMVTAISPGYFRVFRLEPVLGRTFTERDEAEANRVVIVSHSYWTSHLGATPTLNGLFVRLRGISYAVVGVMPLRFDFPGSTQVWVPRSGKNELGLNLSTNEPLAVKEWAGWIGRLAAGASGKRLAAEATAKLHQLNTVGSPRTHVNYGEVVTVQPLAEFISGEIRPVLIALLIGAALVMVIAIANTSALFLTRVAAGNKDAAVRMALGASSARIVRDLVTEAVAMAWVSGGIGVAIAVLFGALLRRSVAQDYAQRLSENSGAGIWVFLSCFCLATIAGVITGLFSAIVVVRQEPNEVLQGRGGLGKSGGRAFRRTLMVLEVALACGLLTVADLSVSSVVKVNRADPGFTADGVLAAECDLPPSLPGTADAMQTQETILSELRGDPGVAAAGISSALPLSGAEESKLYIWVGSYGTSAIQFVVSGDYFRILKIPILAGRSFEADDRDALMVSRRLARQLWPGRNPVGEKLRLDGEDSLREIVGVAADVTTERLAAHPEPQMYLPLNHPFASRAMKRVQVIVRCRGSCTSVSRSLRNRVAATAGGASIYGWISYDDLIQHLMRPMNARAYILGAFAVCAALIAWVGVFAMASYSAACRKFEAGVCAAFGARPVDVAVMLVEEAMGCTLAGLLSGTLLAAGLASLMGSLIFGTGPFDPGSYGRAACILLLGALAGSLAPAIRVARIEVSQALRSREN